MVGKLENLVVHTEFMNRMATLELNSLRSKLLVMLSVSVTVVAIAFTNCSGFKLDNLTDLSFDSNDARAVPRMAIQNPVVVTVQGCNAPTWNQIPDHPDFFVGRLRKGAAAANLETCANDETHTLALGKMNWLTNEIVFLSTLLDLGSSPSLQNGKYVITTAYDPSVTFDGPQDWIAFEC